MNANKVQGLKVKAGVKAGGFTRNHNRTASVIRVRTGLRGGTAIFCKNHSWSLATSR